jgi:hypothetical protein
MLFVMPDETLSRLSHHLLSVGMSLRRPFRIVLKDAKCGIESLYRKFVNKAVNRGESMNVIEVRHRHSSGILMQRGGATSDRLRQCKT